MSSVTLNETVVAGVISRLENDLNAIIAEINAADTYGIELETIPAEQVLDYPPTLREIVNTPVLGFQDMPSKFEDDTGWEATGVHQFAVICWVQDLTQRALVWKLRRYSQAIVRAVLDGRQLDTAAQAWGIKLIRVEPGKTLGRRENPEVKLSWVAVVFEAKRDETW